jgi:hypothetical protein
MAVYQNSTHIHSAAHAEFDTLYKPGDWSSWSGIYRCETCGHEAVHTIGKPLPPQDHHLHPIGVGPIRWRLIVTDSAGPS